MKLKIKGLQLFLKNMKSKYGLNVLDNFIFTKIYVEGLCLKFGNDSEYVSVDFSDVLHPKTNLKKINNICTELYFFINKNHIFRKLESCKKSIDFFPDKSNDRLSLSNIINVYFYEYLK